MKPALVARIQEEIGKVVAAPEIRGRIMQQGPRWCLVMVRHYGR